MAFLMASGIGLRPGFFPNPNRRRMKLRIMVFLVLCELLGVVCVLADSGCA